MDDDGQRKRRAQGRADWPVQIVDLDSPSQDDLSATTTLRERLAMVWRLTVDAWASSGQSMPSYRREEIPGRVVTLGDE